MNKFSNKFLMTGVVTIIIGMTVLSTAVILYPDVISETIASLLWLDKS